jgi:benzodiazapine receptor
VEAGQLSEELTMPSSPGDWLLLGASLVLTFVAAAIGGVVTARPVRTWYGTIRKPAWNPPDWLFGPVWTVLYILMGLALWRVWRVGWDQPGVRLPVILFLVQLVLNVLWSVIFFGLRRINWAVVEIVLLWCFLLATMIAFFAVEPLAGWLLVPYLAWVTFAGVLNFTVWQLNR